MTPPFKFMFIKLILLIFTLCWELNLIDNRHYLFYPEILFIKWKNIKPVSAVKTEIEQIESDFIAPLTPSSFDSSEQPLSTSSARKKTSRSKSTWENQFGWSAKDFVKSYRKHKNCRLIATFKILATRFKSTKNRYKVWKIK